MGLGHRTVGRDRRLEYVPLREDERRFEGLDEGRKDPVQPEINRSASISTGNRSTTT